MDGLDPSGKEIKAQYGILNLERRKYPRFSVDLSVEYYRINKLAGFHGRVLDISEGGLLIYFPERMEIGQRLRLRIFFGIGSELNTIELLSEVAWVEMWIDEDWGEYRTGVKFIDISTDNIIKLKDFLTGLSRPS